MGGCTFVVEGCTFAVGGCIFVVDGCISGVRGCGFARGGEGGGGAECGGAVVFVATRRWATRTDGARSAGETPCGIGGGSAMARLAAAFSATIMRYSTTARTAHAAAKNIASHADRLAVVISGSGMPTVTGGASGMVGASLGLSAGCSVDSVG